MPRKSASTQKWHINPETGKPGRCTATVRGCNYGISEGEHYASEQDARAGYEQQQENNKFDSATTKKTSAASALINIPKDQKVNANFLYNRNRPGLRPTEKSFGTVVSTIKKNSAYYKYCTPVSEVDVHNELKTNHGFLVSDLQLKGLTVHNGRLAVEMEDVREWDDYYPDDEREGGRKFAVGDNMGGMECLISENHAYEDFKGDIVDRYVFELPESLREKDTEYQSKKFYDAKNEILDNPHIPDWAVLESHDGDPVKISDARMAGKTDVSDIHLSVVELSSKINNRHVLDDVRLAKGDVFRAQDSWARARFAADRAERLTMPQINELDQEVKQLEEAYSMNIPPAAKDAVKKQLLVKRDDLNKLNEKMQAATNPEKLERVQQKLVEAQKQEELADNRYKEAVKEAVVDLLANRYPSDNKATRNRAAKQWLKQHPECVDEIDKKAYLFVR